MSAVVLGILDRKTARLCDRPRYDRFLLGMAIVNIVNSTVLSKLVIIKFSKFGAAGFSPIVYTESCAANAKEVKKSDYPKTRC